MRWIYAIVNKVKFLVVILVDLMRYICCIKRNRRRPSTDYVPLSSVGVVSNDKFLQITSDDDARCPIPSHISAAGYQQQPPTTKNVQDYIAEYRQQKYKAMTNEPAQDVPTDYFQDMIPKIRQQQKVLVKQKESQHLSGTPSAVNSRLTFAPVTATAITKGNELANWEEMENADSWDVDEQNTDQILREERQLERERRMLENSKKRMDKERSRFGGSKIS